MGTFNVIKSKGSGPGGPYASSPERQAQRTQRFGAEHSGRTESRMQQMRKHRAARRSQRKEAGIFGPKEAAKQKSIQRGEQRQERHSLMRRQSAVGRSYAGSRAERSFSRPRPSLRERASSDRSGYARTGGGTATGISRADQMRQILGDPNRPRPTTKPRTQPQRRRISYGGEQQSGRRRQQMRDVLGAY